MNHNLIIFPWINCVGFSLFEFINAFGDINGISDARIYFRNIPIEKIKQNQQYQFSCLFKATLSKYMITNSHVYSTIDHFSPNHFSIKFNLQYIKKCYWRIRIMYSIDIVQNYAAGNFFLYAYLYVHDLMANCLGRCPCKQMNNTQINAKSNFIR